MLTDPIDNSDGILVEMKNGIHANSHVSFVRALDTHHSQCGLYVEDSPERRTEPSGLTGTRLLLLQNHKEGTRYAY